VLDEQVGVVVVEDLLHVDDPADRLDVGGMVGVGVLDAGCGHATHPRT
jgi:hypothetical protein